MTDLVRICPICRAQNSPDETFCACGAYLADVDFSHVGIPVVEVAPAPVLQSVEFICPHADCAQPNPAGSVLCVYCNRPLAMPVVAQEDELQSALPPMLRAQFRVLERLPTEGGQADLVLVETPQHEQRVVKLYRRGIQPDWQVLERLPQVHSPHLVQIFQHGVAEHIAYEVMAYCAAGSARTLINNWPLTNDTLRRLIEQLATTLMALHAQHILHRDLKPENILLRQINPLDIALIDFGASSLQMATQYFTKGARTAHYAAPEVLTGVLDEKSDWWAVGMMVLEAITGRHPYAGLSEQVALHQLATQSVDVHGVMDDRLRMLCRGLLLRNPSKRWGGEELTRWLAGDETLTMPDDAGDGTAVRPYTLRKAQCRTRSDLALALAQHWEDGIKDLRRGVITQWVEQDLRDFDLARDLHDILARHELSDDGRLLRVIVSALPGIPPVWQGKVITQDNLARAAMQAKDGQRSAAMWLFSIYKEGVLKFLGDSGNVDMLRISQAWKTGVAHYRAVWEQSKVLEEDNRRHPTTHHAQEVVDVDYLLYLAPIRMNVPLLDTLLPDVVLSLYVPQFVRAAQETVRVACATTAEHCAWFTRLVDETTDKSDVFWSVAQSLLPFAIEDAGKENQRRKQVVRNAQDDVLQVVVKLQDACDNLLKAIQIDELTETEAETVRRALATWIGFAAWIKKLEHENPSLNKIVAQLNPINSHAITTQSFLDRYQHLLAINAIWTKPSRVMFAALFILGGFSLNFYLPFMAWLLLAVFVYSRSQQAVQGEEEGFSRLRRLHIMLQAFREQNLVEKVTTKNA